jgi:hypothetical protein
MGGAKGVPQYRVLNRVVLGNASGQPDAAGMLVRDSSLA